MANANRLLRILAMFDLSRPVITPEWLMAQLDVSRASVYRDLGQLVGAGMLERVPDCGYVLGPRVVELDRQIRLTDPLLQAAEELLGRLAEETAGTVLLCRFHGDKVMCIHQATSSRGRDPALTVSYERGRAMPLYRGATSKVILAWLPLATLKRLWAAERAALVAAGLPDDFGHLLDLLAAIRAEGHVVTGGEVDTAAVGFAAPLRDGEHLLGSLSIVMPVASVSATVRRTTLARLLSTAGRIEGRLQDQRDRARATRKANSL